MNALLLVDLQRDFLPGGALAVPDGDQVVPVANRLTPAFDLVVATRDWHPADHISFAANHPDKRPGEVISWQGLSQVLWPVHCVENSPGAEFAPGLETAAIDHVVKKGTDKNLDSYSGFFDNDHRNETGLGDYLKTHGATDVYIMGLATDYCVKFTALDARQLGFQAHLIADGCRGVELKPGDVARAINEMLEAGVEVVDSDEWLEKRGQ